MAVGPSARLLITAFGAVCVVACERDAPPGPAPGSDAYAETVAAFHTGVAAIQVGADERAQQALSRAAELAPGEPAVLANLAILAFQQRRLDDASRLVGESLALEDVARLRLLGALVERVRGDLDAAIEHARAAVVDATSDAAAAAAAVAPPAPEAAVDAQRSRYLLARLLEQRGGVADVDESRSQFDTLLEDDAAGGFIVLESARHAARHDDADAIVSSLESLASSAAGWPEDARTQLERARVAASSPAAAGPGLTLLAATLNTVPSYRRERERVELSEQQPDLIVSRFLRLPSPRAAPPPPDIGLAFAAGDPIAEPGGWLEARPFWRGDTTAAVVALLRDDGVWLAGDGSDALRVAGSPERGARAFIALDYDHDFLIDLAIAGENGLTLLRQREDGGFEAATGAFPAAAARRATTGVWAADADLDGDIDLVVAPTGAAPVLLRNLSDGRFAEAAPFGDIAGARDFVWGDLDSDGDADAAFVDGAGALYVFSNPRQDRPDFDALDVPDEARAALAIALADMDADGAFDIVALRPDGAVMRVSWTTAGANAVEIARWSDMPSGATRLIVADLDNNGALDLLASAGGQARTWLADSAYALTPHQTLPFAVTGAADMIGRGRIELLGVDEAGAPVRLTARPGRSYYALTIGPRATDQPGDGRINTFGIGGEAEVRAGLLYQKQPIAAPLVHFGIGENTGVTVARIVWPNGVAQAEFDLLASQAGPIVARQRLKGSCPWLFTFDGSDIRFVTDVAWRTALGLRINAVGSAAVVHSEDWVRIRGDQLAPRDGVYDLRITADLWESHFFDHVALLAVDHPADTEVFVDERFTLPPPELRLHATSPLRPVAAARDHRGEDVTALIAARDERYADTFELGRWQGMARDEHYIELDLGSASEAGVVTILNAEPSDGARAATDSLLLIAEGWVYPTDGSINLAMGQGAHPAPRGLRVDVPDGRGGWRVLYADLGMPAGKTKTVVIDLAGAFIDGAPRKVRLATNLEIYWDRIAWAVARPAAELRVTRIAAAAAELRYRGFSHTRQAGRRAPELPDYAVAGTAPVWRDLVGYHTRFGDVRELIADVDDRYAIMNAGDELRLEFPVLADPAEGWVRDYVFVSDAWVKDGDLNNGHSATLRPLPYHGLDDYTTLPSRLADERAYRMHPNDWREYHTRWVSTDRFRRALANR